MPCSEWKNSHNLIFPLKQLNFLTVDNELQYAYVRTTLKTQFLDSVKQQQSTHH